MAFPSARARRFIAALPARLTWWSSAAAGPLRRRQHTILVALLHVALVWCMTLLLTWQGREQSTATWKRVAEGLALMISDQTSNSLLAGDLLLRNMADWVGGKAIGDGEQFREILGERRIFDDMRERVIAMPLVGVGLIFAADGGLVASTRAYPPPRADPSERELFAQAIAAPPGLSLIVSGERPANAPWRFYIARKVANGSGRVLGVVAVGLDTGDDATFFRRISLGDDSWISIVRSDGTLLATSMSSRDHASRRYAGAWLSRLMDSGDATLTVVEGHIDPTAQGRSIVAASKVPGFPAYVAVAVGENAYLQPWRNRTPAIIAIAAVLTLLILAAGAYVLRLVARTEAFSRTEAERRVLSAIVDTPSALTAVIDRSGRIVRCNQVFREALGVQSEDDGLTFKPTVERRDLILGFAAADEPEATDVDVEVEDVAGSRRRLHFSLSRQTLPDSGRCVVMVGHDETQRHQAQQSIAMSARLVTLGEITTSIAHEISQPLNVIRLAVQNALLEAGPGALDDASQPDGLPSMSDAEFRVFATSKFHRVLAQVDRASRIIARMRIFNRKPEGDSSTFDARDVCRNAVALFSQRGRKDDIEIRKKLGDEPLVAEGAQVLMEEVLVFLLRNARDALIASGRPDGIVEVSAFRDDAGNVVMAVADNGPGVPPEIHERIFEPFFTTRIGEKHAGLGLAVAFGAVRDSGGRLRLRDDQPGAVFEIELPPAGAVLRFPSPAT